MTNSFVLIGHVDHGKSTTAGALLDSVGHFSKHEVEQTTQEALNNKMEKWKYAYLLDSCFEERARGKTHEYTTVKFLFEEKEYELIDTPGHKSFVRSTIEALALRNNVVAVIILSVIQSEWESGFERGMMKEQIILARACGITRFVVALNKMDAINFDVDLTIDMQKQVKRFLKSLNVAHVAFVPISAYTATNLDGLMNVIANNFDEQMYNGDCITHPPFAASQLNVQIKVLHCDNIILPAFRCIAHINSQEKETELESLQVLKAQRPFAKKGDVFTGVLTLLNDVVQVKKGDKIILRSADKTIGFGNII